jgi:putative aldouronate transport system permease protein
MKANYFLYIFLLPAIVYLGIFAYGPLYGIQIAFKDFYAFKGIEGSPWVGLKHFRMFFNSPRFSILLTNTLSISVYSLLAGFPIPIILALLLNYTPRRGLKRFAQTVSYAPHFISVVVLVGMLNVFLSPRSGFVNTLLGYIGIQPIFFIGIPLRLSIFRWRAWGKQDGPPIIYWPRFPVSPELHEAAIIDGPANCSASGISTCPPSCDHGDPVGDELRFHHECGL